MSQSQIGQAFEGLVETIRKLRDPKTGCPWDLKQTHESLLQYLLEEAHEFIDAVKQDKSEMPKELGDVLLQVVLHSQIASENKAFDIQEVVEGINKKMIERHPHVFAGKSVANAEEVVKNWETSKKKNSSKSIVDSVPTSLPALQRAQRVSEKASRIGFEWKTVEDVRDKVSEELQEFLAEALSPQTDENKSKEEFGDILFALVQLARRLGYEAEELLNKSTDKFVRRFKQMEKLTEVPLEKLNLQEMDQLWEKVKEKE